MLISVRAGDKEIVNVSISKKREAMKSLTDKALKCLRGVANTKRYFLKFEEFEPVCYSRLMNIGWLHRDLMIGFHQIYFGKNCGSLKGGCKVLDT